MRRLGLCSVLALGLGFALELTSCVLPSFDKVAEKSMDASGISAAGACGLSAKLPKKCDTCVRASCCELAKACPAGSECGKDLLKPITPDADYSTDFDALLGCMQDNCDDACGVSFGCLGNYSLPLPSAAYDIPLRAVDFAASPEQPLPGVTADACNGVDPACVNGKADSGPTDSDGRVTLNVGPMFDGFFQFSGGNYLTSTVVWTEPLYRVGGFSQPLLTDSALHAFAVVTGVHMTADEAFDPAVGHLIFRAHTCLPIRYLNRPEPPYTEAAGIEISIDPNDNNSAIFYTDKSGGVSLSAQATSSDGFGGAFNLPARSLTVTAKQSSTGREIAHGTVIVRPGTIGFIYLVPSSK